MNPDPTIPATPTPSGAANQAMHCAEDITELVRGNPRDGGSRVFQAAITLRIEEAITAATAEQALVSAQRIAELEREWDEAANAAYGGQELIDQLRETISDLQSRVTVAEQRAEDRAGKLEQEKKAHKYSLVLADEQLEQSFYKAVENAGPCGACAEGIACGSTGHEHVGCPIAERDTLRTQLAEARAQAQEAGREVRWLFDNCKIVYFNESALPHDALTYPIEHNPHARKDAETLIRSFAARASTPSGDGTKEGKG